METVFAVVGGDDRMRYLALELADRGHTVRTFAVAGLPDTAAELAEVLAPAAYVILPMPAVDPAGICNRQGMTLTPKELAEALPEHCALFGGKLGGAARILKRRAAVWDYFHWEPLVLANVVPTVEGAIQLAMENLPTTVQGSRFLITGAGRIGLALGRRLRSLGARVTVTGRREESLTAIRCADLNPEETGIYRQGLAQYDCVINTVPAPILTPEQLEQLREDCILIELASAPGGFSRETAQLLGRTVICGSALPGRVAPKTAGHLILESILHHIAETEAEHG